MHHMIGGHFLHAFFCWKYFHIQMFALYLFGIDLFLVSHNKAFAFNLSPIIPKVGEIAVIINTF